MRAPVVRFLGEDCTVSFVRYHNDRVAIELTCEDGSSMARATVNLPEVPLAEDEVAVKDYSENAGMLSALMSAGIVSAPVRWVESGWVKVPVCRVLTTSDKTR